MTIALLLGAALALLVIAFGYAYRQPAPEPRPKTFEEYMLGLTVAFNEAAIAIGTAMTPAMDQAATAFNRFNQTWADEIAKHPTWQDMIDQEEAQHDA
jgi:hypothetical protein